MSRRLIAACALVLAMSACAPHVPLIKQPIRIEAFCGNDESKKARPTAIASNMTSTSDTIIGATPSDADVRRATASGDGAIAYWHDQVLALPRVSVALGERDGYARVRAAAVTPHQEGSDRRRIYLDVRDHGTFHWIALDAFDLEDVCVEGKPQT